MTDHCRAAPLVWLTAWKEEIATQRNDFENACLCRLAGTVPAGCRVTVLADRGFGDQKLFAFLDKIGFGYVIRFHGNIRMTDTAGTSKPAAEWRGVRAAGRASCATPAKRRSRLRGVTAKGQLVGAVVCVHAKAMKEPWCLAASDAEAPAAILVNHYGDHQDVWGAHAAAARAAPFPLSLASPGYQRSNSSPSVPSSFRLRVCGNSCAPRLVHCIC